MDLVDPRLGLDFNKEEIMVMINMAFLCTNVSPIVKPTMSLVVNMREGKTIVQDIVYDPNAPCDDLKLMEMEEHYHYIQEKSMGLALLWRLIHTKLNLLKYVILLLNY